VRGIGAKHLISAAGLLGLVLRGRFIIHGVTRDASIPTKVRLRPDGVSVLGTTPLNLKNYKIGGLSRMREMFTMHEEIVVH
jgi:hypothetical protein